jgi:hypothetical protein
MVLDDESWLIYKYPSKIGDIKAKLARQAAAEKARQADTHYKLLISHF